MSIQLLLLSMYRQKFGGEHAYSLHREDSLLRPA